jgi:hypothetical protein
MQNDRTSALPRVCCTRVSPSTVQYNLPPPPTTTPVQRLAPAIVPAIGFVFLDIEMHKTAQTYRCTVAKLSER